jgi:hypothetical protein
VPQAVAQATPGPWGSSAQPPQAFTAASPLQATVSVPSQLQTPAPQVVLQASPGMPASAVQPPQSFCDGDEQLLAPAPSQV